MSYTLLFWKERPQLGMAAAVVCRELMWGEDVEGLIDLPVKEILDRLKAEFPQHLERPGSLMIQGGAGKCEVTWTWQHVKFECHDWSPDERQRLCDVLGEFECSPYDPQIDVR